MRVAVLGTGIMGTGMTHALLRAGHQVTVWNRTSERARPLADDGATVADSLAEAVADVEVIITVLFDRDAVAAVAREALPVAAPDAVWVQSSTVGPDAAREFGRLAEIIPIAYLDAPVVGTKVPAEQGTLSTLVSGRAEVIETVRPMLEAISAKITVAGSEPGQASILKLVCNAWASIVTTGVAQSIALAEAAGLDPALFLEAIDGQATGSPMAQAKGRMMIDSDYSAAFAIDGLAKDLELIKELAVASGVPTVLIGPMEQLVAGASADGHGDDDIAAVRTQF